MIFKRIVVVLMPVLMLLLIPCHKLLANDYQILVSKKNSELKLQKDGRIIKTYHIATGKGGKGTKRKRGDSKTPLGTYRITELKDSDRFHFFMQLDYPNLIDAWYGYKNQIIDSGEFKRIASAYKKREIPPQDTQLGGFIGIHGLGETTEKKLTIHEELDWTEGCIALTNEEIIELKQYVDIGTQVVIVE